MAGPCNSVCYRLGAAEHAGDSWTGRGEREDALVAGELAALETNPNLGLDDDGNDITDARDPLPQHQLPVLPVLSELRDWA